jgi:hypothetical protein
MAEGAGPYTDPRKGKKIMLIENDSCTVYGANGYLTDEPKADALAFEPWCQITGHLQEGWSALAYGPVAV